MPNCWEFKECEKEKKCPVYPDRGFDCWNVEGTLCKGSAMGQYDDKIDYCRSNCDFYKGVILTGTIKPN